MIPADRSEAEHRLHADALARVLRACQSAGVTAGIYAGTGAAARGYAAQGFRMLTVAWDAGLLEEGGRAELAAARGA